MCLHQGLASGARTRATGAGQSCRVIIAATAAADAWILGDAHGNSFFAVTREHRHQRRELAAATLRKVLAALPDHASPGVGARLVCAAHRRGRASMVLAARAQRPLPVLLCLRLSG